MLACEKPYVSAMGEFLKEVAPHLFANLLTVVLVYSYWEYARLERKGEDNSLEGLIRIAVAIMVLSFCGLGIYHWSTA